MGVHVWAFLGVSLVLIIAPGPDTVLVAKNAVVHGRRAGLGTGFGVCAGLLVWSTAAALGLAALVRGSSIAFTVLKTAGAAYLVWLGAGALWAAYRRAPHDSDRPPGHRAPVSGLRGFRQGLLSDLGNPKIAVFFTSLLPQFVTGGESPLLPFLLLGTMFCLIALIWVSGYAVAAAKLSAVLRRPAIKAAIDTVCGAVLVGLGIRLALERR